MPSKLFSFPAILLMSASLLSCTQSNEEQSIAADSIQPSIQAATTPYDNTITIREIMSALIDPHADILWNSVRVVADIDGIKEYAPETDEEWATLRVSAVSIIEGANSLMTPGRQVARPGAVGEFPEFEFTPEEVQEILLADPQSWVGFSRGLQNSAFEMLQAIDSRDADLLSETGAYLDEACEACHAKYWYREGI